MGLSMLASGKTEKRMGKDKFSTPMVRLTGANLKMIKLMEKVYLQIP